MLTRRSLFGLALTERPTLQERLMDWPFGQGNAALNGLTLGAIFMCVGAMVVATVHAYLW